MIVLTSLFAPTNSGTARIELPSLSATNSERPSEAKPLGCANEAKPVPNGWSGNSGPSTMSSRELPAKGPISVSVERHPPNLMRAGHRDVEILSMDPNIPRTAERRLPRMADETPRQSRSAGDFFRAGEAGPTVFGLPAGAGDRHDALLLQIDFAQQMVFGVGDVEHFAVEREALRPIEFGGREIAVGPALTRRCRSSRAACRPGW